MLLDKQRFLQLSWNITTYEYFIRVFSYKMAVLLERGGVYNVFEYSNAVHMLSTDCSIRKYQCIFMELSSIVWSIHLIY